MASHDATSYVRTQDIKHAIDGQEQRILDALNIPWPNGRKPHIDCPYPEHGGKDDWRWDDKKGKAFCTCSKSDSIFDVIRKCEGLGDDRTGFDPAKIRAAEIIDRQDLIKLKRQVNGQRYQGT